jgi:hypothetical protein
VVALVIGVPDDERAGALHGLLHPARRQGTRGAAAQPGLHGGGGAVPGRDQPGGVDRAAVELHAGQQLAELPDGRAPGQRRTRGQHGVDVDHDAVREHQHDRVAADGKGGAEAAAQLRQGPPQGGQRVVGPGEEQLGQLAAGHRSAGQVQVAEQAPGLATARAG